MVILLFMYVDGLTSIHRVLILANMPEQLNNNVSANAGHNGLQSQAVLLYCVI
jgi:hypothetical protein